VLKKGEVLRTAIGDGEQLLFVWKGAIVAKAGEDIHKAGEKDAVFASGPAKIDVVGDSAEPAIVFQVQAPPHSKELAHNGLTCGGQVHRVLLSVGAAAGGLCASE
jgi:hypothetical protein